MYMRILISVSLLNNTVYSFSYSSLYFNTNNKSPAYQQAEICKAYIRDPNVSVDNKNKYLFDLENMMTITDSKKHLISKQTSTWNLIYIPSDESMRPVGLFEIISLILRPNQKSLISIDSFAKEINFLNALKRNAIVTNPITTIKYPLATVKFNTTLISKKKVEITIIKKFNEITNNLYQSDILSMKANSRNILVSSQYNMRLTYLDSDMLIFRDKTGTPMVLTSDR